MGMVVLMILGGFVLYIYSLLDQLSRILIAFAVFTWVYFAVTGQLPYDGLGMAMEVVHNAAI